MNPCGDAAQATAEGPGYPVRNGTWDGDSETVLLAGAASELLTFQLD